jgi:hypothetical protein
MPLYLLLKIRLPISAVSKAITRSEKYKMAEDSNSLSSHRKLIDPTNKVDQVFINHFKFTFPNLLIRTEDHVCLPLRWFTNGTLTFIIQNILSFLMQKTYYKKPIPMLNMHTIANSKISNNSIGNIWTVLKSRWKGPTI